MSGGTQLRPLMIRARKAGWTVEMTRGCHLRWQAPDGRFYFSSSTPSDVRALRNIEKALIRLGLPT